VVFSFSTLFQLYRSGQVFLWRKSEGPEKTIGLSHPSHFSKVYLKKQTKYQIVSGETRAAKDHVNFGVLPFLLHFYRFWVNITVGGLLIPKGIIRPVVSVSTLRKFNKYIYY
jgi:hypothetical protein